MKYDISALGNALVDTQYMVEHEFLESIGLEADSMTLASAEEHSPIINKLQQMGVESVSDCGGSACLLYTSPSPRDLDLSRMPSSA